MEERRTLASILTAYMTDRGWGDAKLAKRGNLLLGKENFLHRSNIRNWRTGERAKRIADWRQLVVIAYILEVQAEDFELLLQICEHPAIEKLFADVESPYLELMEPWIEELSQQQTTRIDNILATLPAKNYDLFIGRKQDRITIINELLTKEKYRLINVFGVSGSGKTALAQEVTRSLIKEDLFQNVVWVDFGSESSPGWLPSDSNGINLLWIHIANALKLSLRIGNDYSEEIIIQQIREKLDTPFLIVIDNLQSNREVEQQLSQLHQLLQRNGRFLLLSHARLSQRSFVFTYPLQQLPKQEAINLLYHHANISEAANFSDVDYQQFDQIYDLVGGHPQALMLIAHLAQDYSLTPLVDELIQNHNEDISQLIDQIYEHIWHKLTEQGQQLLWAMSLVSHTGASEAYLLAFSGLSEQKLWPAIKQLVDFAVLHRNRKGVELFYYTHQLTNSFLKRHGKSEDDDAIQDNSLEGMLGRLCDYWHIRIEKLTLQDLSNHFFNLSKALRMGIDCNTTWEKAASSATEMTFLVENSLYWQAWVSLLKKALAKDPQENPATRRQILSRLGLFQRLDDDLEEAIQSHHKALAIAEELDDIKAQGQSHFSLCIDYRCARQYERAQIHGETALDIFEELDLGSPFLAPTLNILGLTAHFQTNFKAAQMYFAQASKLYKSISHLSGLSRTYNNWGNVLYDDNHPQEALDKLKIALAYAQQSQGSLDNEIVSISLCMLYLDLDNVTEAQQICTQPVLDYKQEERPMLHRALMAECHGRLCRKKNLLSEAKKHFYAAINMWKELGDNISLATIRTFLAEAQFASGNYSGAVTQARMARDLFYQANNDPWGRFVFTKYELTLNKILQTKKQTINSL
ncbi:MAG: AAA family ATPase [Anaerolineales bacterium]|nr:AAA family ATPase [Anaerolineales bacterium]